MTLNNSPLIILTARRIVKPNSNSDKIKIVSIDRGGAQRRELKIRRSEGKKEKKKEKAKGKKEKQQDKRMHPLPKEYVIAGKNGSTACIVSFQSSRDQYLLDKPVYRSDRSLKLCAWYICTYKRRRMNVETREGTMNGLRSNENIVFKLSVIINNDEFRSHLALLSDLDRIQDS